LRVREPEELALRRLELLDRPGDIGAQRDFGLRLGLSLFGSSAAGGTSS